MYTGPALRWRKEYPGTVVSVRDAFYNVRICAFKPSCCAWIKLNLAVQLPIRRRSHPNPARTVDLVKREVESFALVFPCVSFTVESTYKAKEGIHARSKARVLTVPKVRPQGLLCVPGAPSDTLDTRHRRPWQRSGISMGEQ